jgi:hypothetical protein
MDHGQARTDPRMAEAAGLLRAKKRLEEVRRIRGRYAVPTVFHGECRDLGQ